MKRDIFQALSDPTRRAILILLATQTMTPNALAEQFDMTRQAVSKHIRYLDECDVLKQDKKGREIYYHFKPEKLSEVETWLGQIKNIWNDRFNQLDEVLTDLKSKQNEK
ncbi:ArsR/SmtB family transcription factor [Saccharicrinis sp. FJH62]|uniref:ArsR/SmtB family transcription factor n=1 Tax=Saccharicrinis sp. FJH62 TaxID=3344657 RepID=UPI0035D45C1E